MEADIYGAAQSIAVVLIGISALLIAFALLLRVRRDTLPARIASQRRTVALLHRLRRMRSPSLLERMIDKGSLTLSIDKALWAVAGIILAFKSPTAFAAAVQFVQSFR